MRIRDFSGGINKRLDPTLIAQNEAQELINADISSGALCAAKAAKQQALPDGTVLEDHGFYHKKWYPDDTQNSWLTFRDKVYFSKNLKPCFFDGDTPKELGIEPVSEADANLISLEGSATRQEWTPTTQEIRGGLDNLVFPNDIKDQITNGTAYNAGGALHGIDPNRVTSQIIGNSYNVSGFINFIQGVGIAINTLKLILVRYTNHTNTVIDRLEYIFNNISCSNFELDFKQFGLSVGLGDYHIFCTVNNNLTKKLGILRQNSALRKFKYSEAIDENIPNVSIGSNHIGVVLINRLPKSKTTVPTIHWRTKATQATSINRRYLLQVFSTLGGPPTNTYQFDIENNASDIEFIIEDNEVGYNYSLWRVEDLRNAAPTRKLGDFTALSQRAISETIETLYLRDNNAGKDWNALAAAVSAPVVAYNTYVKLNASMVPSIVPTDAQYAITNVNETLAIQSTPRLIQQILPSNVNISLRQIPPYSAPSNRTVVEPTHRYFYRIDNTRPNFTFVGKLPIDKVNNTVFYDNYSDSGRFIYIYTTIPEAKIQLHSAILEKTTDASGNITFNTFESRSATEVASLVEKNPSAIPDGYWDGITYEPPDGFTLSLPSGTDTFYRFKLELNHVQNGNKDRYEVYYRLRESLNSLELQLINEEDLSIVGETLNSLRNFTPENLKYLSLYANIFFGVSVDKPSILYFSRIGRPHYWPKENFIELENPIHGLLEVHQGLLIFTLNETYLLTGYNAETFQIAVISKEYGTIENGHKTMAFARSLPLWITPHGIATYMNGRVEIISRDKLADEYPWKMAQSTIFINDQYYILFPEGRVLCLDMQYNTRYLEYDFFETPVANYNAYPKSLAIYDNQPAYIIREPDARDADNTANPPIPAIPDRTQKNGIYLMFKAEAVNEVIPRLNMTYKGPTFTEGSPATLKNYSFYYISKTGQVEIRLDKDSVTDTPGELISRCDINSDTKKPIPGSKSRAYSITPEFTGTGCVREFYLEPTRETQKDR